MSKNFYFKAGLCAKLLLGTQVNLGYKGIQQLIQMFLCPANPVFLEINRLKTVLYGELC